jgi:hypothetical protein
MSATDKPDPVRSWRYAEKLLDDEADRIAALGDEDFDREMAALPEPSRVPSTGELLARAEERARQHAADKVSAVPSLPRPTPWVVWLVAATLGAVALALVVERHEVVAWLRREPAPIGPDRWSPEKVPTPVERASKLRDEAVAACAGALWGTCRDKLDEAQQLDPAGESDARV